MSAMINVLYLTGSFFMLEVYDRVVPSRSVPTLIGLVILAAFLYTAQGVLDLIRSRILVRIGTSLDESLGARVFDTVARLPLKAGQRNDGMLPIRDLDSIRSFMGSLGPIAMFDLPWMPFYIAICFVFHPLIGDHRARGAIILTVVTLTTERLTSKSIREATGLAIARNALADVSRRNAEALIAMGMLGRIAHRWHETNQKYLASQRRVSDVAGGLGSVSKVFRMMLQSAVLAVGGYLVINQEATAGIIIAGSILAARALAPVDLAIANWKGFVAARQGWARLNQLLNAMPAEAPRMALHTPSRSAQRGERRGHGARHAEGGGAGRAIHARSRQRARHHRAERVGQVVGRPHAGRRLDAGARQGAARRRRARPMVLGSARPAYRLSAAGRRADGRQRGAEHRPFRARARFQRGHRRRQGRRRA